MLFGGVIEITNVTQTRIELTLKNHRFKIQYIISFAGVFSSGATPVPIPNTEVKPASGDGIAGLTLWESSTTPALFSLKPDDVTIIGLFFARNLVA